VRTSRRAAICGGPLRLVRHDVVGGGAFLLSRSFRPGSAKTITGPITSRQRQGFHVVHVHDQNRVLAFHRRVEGEGCDVMVVVHLSTFTRVGYRIGFPSGGEWREVFNFARRTRRLHTPGITRPWYLLRNARLPGLRDSWHEAYGRWGPGLLPNALLPLARPWRSVHRCSVQAAKLTLLTRPSSASSMASPSRRGTQRRLLRFPHHR
jgi:hypothetical protein